MPWGTFLTIISQVLIVTVVIVLVVTLGFAAGREWRKK